MTTTTTTPSVKLIKRGAALQELLVGGRNIVLNFHSESEYADNPAHFGATIGRVANRIAGAKIHSLNNASVSLEANNGPNSLHGGPKGWGKLEWRGPELSTKDGRETVTYRLTSPHGDEGFPGEVEVVARYTPYETQDGKFVLEMDYEATLVGGADETVINITNHSYFNIGPGPTIEGTHITLPTSSHLPLDSTGIPSSTSTAAYAGITANEAFVLGATAPNVDDCFIQPDVNPAAVPIDTRAQPLRLCATAWHPDTRIHLEVRSSDPAFQFYTGKYVDVAARPDGTPARGPRAGFCVEPSRFVDAINREEWRGMILVKKGETYGSKITYTAWKD